MQLTAKKNKLVLYCNYDEREIPKSLKGRWNQGLKAWTFSPSVISYRAITESGGEGLSVDKRLKEHFEGKLMSLKEASIDFKFKTIPYNHQIKSTTKIVNNEKFFIFAGVGTGKSKIAIDAVSALHNHRMINRVLVISPASIMWNFADQVKVHSHFDSTIIQGSLQKRKELIQDSTTMFDIINYEILEKLEAELINKKYDMVILDEIHYCKSRQSNRAKAAFKVCNGIQRRVGLSGTIISNNYEDVYMPYKIIDKTIFGENFSIFKMRYFQMGGYMDYQIMGYKKEDEIKKLIASNSICFDIRDIKDLPPEVIVKKFVNLSDKSMKLYKNIKDEMMIEYGDTERPVFNVLERLLRLSQVTSGFTVNEDSQIIQVSNEKLSVLKDVLIDTDGKIAVFVNFRNSIDRISELCTELKISHYIYDGRTKDKGLYKKFNEDDTKVWIAQLKKGEGYSIPKAKVSIFFELNHSRKDHEQSKGRNLRVEGSEEGSCVYVYILARNTIDEAILRTIKDKDFNSKMALEYVKGVNLY